MNETSAGFGIVAAGALAWGAVQFIRADEPVQRLEGDLFLLMAVIAAAASAILASLNKERP